MTSRKLIFSCVIAILIGGFAACGGGSGPTPPPAGISVAFSPAPPVSLAAGASTPITAVVSNDSSSGGVQWTLACGGSQCGTVSPTTTASNSPTTFTAPATVPTPNTVTVTATSVTDGSKSASATITIGTAAAVLPDGTYVFHVAGEDTNNGSPYYLAGAFVVQGGAITSGEQDFIDFQVVATDTFKPATCRLSVSSDSNIQIVLDTGDANVGVNGVETLSGSVVSASRALISQFDTFGSGTGSLDLQTTPATPTGGYAFYLAGLDNGNPVGIFAMGGILNLSGGNLSVGNSIFDVNDGGSFEQAQLFNSGTVSAPDNLGRITLNLTPSTASGLPAMVLAGYVVNANRIELVEQNDSFGGTTGGTAFGQGTNTGTFNAGTVAGTSYVLSASGEDVNGALHVAGVVNLDASGNVTGNLAVNDLAATTNGAAAITGTYTVDPTGRVTLNNVTDSTVFEFTLQLYLDGNGNALEVGMDAGENTAGLANKQNLTTPTFAGAYALAANGFDGSAEVFWSALGPVTNTSGTLAGFTDYNVLGELPVPNVTLSGTATGSQGIFDGTILGLNADVPTANNQYVYFLVDNTRTVGMEVDQSQLGLLYFEAASK